MESNQIQRKEKKRKVKYSIPQQNHSARDHSFNNRRGDSEEEGFGRVQAGIVSSRSLLSPSKSGGASIFMSLKLNMTTEK